MTTALENNKYDIIFTKKVKWTFKVFLNNTPENSVFWHPLIGNGRKKNFKKRTAYFMNNGWNTNYVNQH